MALTPQEQNILDNLLAKAVEVAAAPVEVGLQEILTDVVRVVGREKYVEDIEKFFDKYEIPLKVTPPTVEVVPPSTPLV